MSDATEHATFVIGMFNLLHLDHLGLLQHLDRIEAMVVLGLHKVDATEAPGAEGALQGKVLEGVFPLSGAGGLLLRGILPLSRGGGLMVGAVGGIGAGGMGGLVRGGVDDILDTGGIGVLRLRLQRRALVGGRGGQGRSGLHGGSWLSGVVRGGMGRL